jgi:hypothetical protein
MPPCQIWSLPEPYQAALTQCIEGSTNKMPFAKYIICKEHKKQMKKFLSLILALVMVISCAAMIFADDAAVTTTAATDDETASAYYDAVKLLVSYNIMHGKGDGKLGVYDNIKRYEMALFIGRVLTGWVEDTAWEDGTQNSSEFNDLAGTAAEA